jgi:hypothetical protein
LSYPEFVDGMHYKEYISIFSPSTFTHVQGIPILCRLYGLGFDPDALEPAIVIPTDMGYVSLIGMYHGVDKPDLEKFVDPLLVELRQLHPHMPKMIKRPGSKRYKREFGVMVRGMICDAKERPWLKGERRPFVVIIAFLVVN